MLSNWSSSRLSIAANYKCTKIKLYLDKGFDLAHTICKIHLFLESPFTNDIQIQKNKSIFPLCFTYYLMIYVSLSNCV